MPLTGNTNRMGRLGTVDLLIEACFVKKLRNISSDLKSKLVRKRRSTVLNLPLKLGYY